MTDCENYDENLFFGPGNIPQPINENQLYEMLKKLNRKLTIADIALRVLAKSGNEVARLALEEMKK